MSSSTNDLGTQQTKDEHSNLNEVFITIMPNDEANQIQDNNVLIQKIHDADPNYKKIPKEITDKLSPYVMITKNEMQLNSKQSDISSIVNSNFGFDVLPGDVEIITDDNYVSHSFYEDDIKFRLNKIAARWPTKAVAKRFFVIYY